MNENKEHYEVLDGLRGVAALGVFGFHMLEWVFKPALNPLRHAACVVDFFFCLSGYVIAHAYDARMAHRAAHPLGFKGFALRRVIRLHPMVIVGILWGLAMYLLDPFVGLTHRPQAIGYGVLASNVGFGLLLLPAPALILKLTYSLNGPAWSLGMEYVSNIIYGTVGNRVSRSALAIVIAASSIWLLWICVKYDTLVLGAQWNDWWVGLARLGTSFTVGVLLYRMGARWRVAHTFPVATVLLLATMFYPTIRGWNGVTEWLLAVLIYPCIVIVGAGITRVEGRWGPICRFSGRLSYPLYMMHYAQVLWFAHWHAMYKPTTHTMWMVFSANLLLGITISWAVLRWIDEPVRAKLSRGLPRQVTVTA